MKAMSGRVPRSKGKAKGKPIEVVEFGSARIPIYNAGSGRVNLAYYADGKRKMVRCKSIDAGIERAKEIAKTLTNGTAHIAQLSARELAVIDVAVSSLRTVNTSLSEAVSTFVRAKQILGEANLLDAAHFYSKHLADVAKRQGVVAVRFPELVEKFLQNLRASGKSKRYLYDMQARLGIAAKAFRGLISEIRAEEIDEWLMSLRVSARTKNNYRTALVSAFSWARTKGFLARGQQTEAEFSTRHSGSGGDIGIYTPGQMQLLLSGIGDRLLPFVVIGGFAGLRSAEISRMEWQDINFQQNFIEVSKHKAKTASRRLAPLLPNLKQWLHPLRKERGKVLDGVRDEFHLAKLFREAIVTIRTADEMPFRPVHNGLRHSFVSYRLAVVKNAAQVALEAGNSPKIIMTNYRELVAPGEAKAWFAIRPEKAS